MDKIEHFLVVATWETEAGGQTLDVSLGILVISSIRKCGEMAQRAEAPCFDPSLFGLGPTSLTSLIVICLPNTRHRHSQPLSCPSSHSEPAGLGPCLLSATSSCLPLPLNS